MDSHIPYGNHSVSQNTSFGYMKLTNINDNLSNYIFQASVKLSLVVSSVKVGSCHTLEQERFCWEIWKKVGLPEGSFGLHSLRSGGATAAGNVVPERSIQKHGRWKVESSKNRYIHELYLRKCC